MHGIMKALCLCYSILLLSLPAKAIEIFVGTPIESTFTDPNRVALLEFDTVKGTVYQIEYSSDLATWKSYGNSFVGSGNFTSQPVSGRGEASVYFRLSDTGKATDLPSAIQREWQNHSGGRVRNAIYTNTEDHEIEVYSRGSSGYLFLSVRKDANEGFREVAYSNSSTYQSVRATIPAGWQYKTEGSSMHQLWMELR